MRILRWSLFAGLLFLPLMDGGLWVLGNRIQIFDIYFTGLLLLALLAFRQQVNLVLRTNPWMLVACAVLVSSWFLASILASRTDLALLGAFRNLRLFAFAVILALSIRSIDNIRFLLAGLLAAVAWVTLIGLIQSIWGNAAIQIRANTQVNALHYLGTPGQYGQRTVTAFGDPIMSGHFIAVGISVALGRLFSSRNSSERLALAILAFCAVVPLLTSASRGPIAAAIAAAAALAFFSGLRRRGLVLLLCAAGLALVFGADVLGFLSSLDIFSVTMARIGFGLESSRWEYWSTIMSMSESYPLGVGLGNFPHVAPRHIPAYLLSINIAGWHQTNVHAESMYLTQLIEIGWLGYVAFVGLVGCSVFNSWKLFIVSRNVRSAAQKDVRAALFAAWICISMSMLTTYGYDNIGIAMLFWSLVGFSLVSPWGRTVKLNLGAAAPYPAGLRARRGLVPGETPVPAAKQYGTRRSDAPHE